MDSPVKAIRIARRGGLHRICLESLTTGLPFERWMIETDDFVVGMPAHPKDAGCLKPKIRQIFGTFAFIGEGSISTGITPYVAGYPPMAIQSTH